MDVKRTKKSNALKAKPKWLAMSAVCVSALVFLLQQPAGASKVSERDIWTAQVQQGNLALEVDGFGKLASKTQRLLTAPSNALVEEILLRPGALVSKDSVIVRLSNPEMKQAVRNAKRALENSKAEYRQMLIAQQREKLTKQALLSDLDANLSLAQLKVEAEQKLLADGIVSAIDFKRSTTQRDLLKQRLSIETQLVEQIASGHQESLAIQQQKISQQQEQLEVITSRVQRLTVTAGIDGVLQQLPVELGQNVSLGEQVALVGSMSDLVAHLQVPQSYIEQLEIGQQVDVDTRGGEVEGKIKLIDPVVQQGSVLLEVELVGDLPANARPELKVDGVVHTGMLSNALYIKKPVGARPGSQTTLFKLSDNTLAHAQQISFGVEAGQFIQIIAGAKVGESFILSDMTRWQSHNTLSIED